MEFPQAVDIILSIEGDLVDNVNDPGVITNFGISLRAFPELGRQGIINLTKEKGIEMYREKYWKAAVIGLQVQKQPGFCPYKLPCFASLREKNVALIS